MVKVCDEVTDLCGRIVLKQNSKKEATLIGVFRAHLDTSMVVCFVYNQLLDCSYTSFRWALHLYNRLLSSKIKLLRLWMRIR